MNFLEYLNKDIKCSCGKIHRCYIKEIIIKDRAIKELARIIEENEYKNIFVVADNNTWKAAGKKVLNAIDNASRKEDSRAGIKMSKFIFRQEELIPDESVIGTLFVNVPSECDLVIAIGSGTINDLCKLVSEKIKADYCIVATAPSMDGFASNVSPLILNHLKTTINTKIPDYIIGDLEVLSKAPANMIAAGAGDIIGKYVCLTDWKMANLINGEYYCDEMETLVRKSIEKVVGAIEPYIGKNDNSFLSEKKTISSIMEGLVLSGIAMSFVGNSRPASGSEHHLSHYWEMMFLFEGKKMVPHGTKVAIGTVKTIKLYEKMKKKKPDFDMVRKNIHFNKKEWEEEIRRVYRQTAEDVIKLENECEKNSDKDVLRRVDILEEKWEEAVNIMNTLPSSVYIEDLLKAMDAPYKPKQVGVDKATVKESVKYAKELRNRYGLLQMMFDMGRFEL